MPRRVSRVSSFCFWLEFSVLKKHFVKLLLFLELRTELHMQLCYSQNAFFAKFWLLSCDFVFEFSTVLKLHFNSFSHYLQRKVVLVHSTNCKWILRKQSNPLLNFSKFKQCCTFLSWRVNKHPLTTCLFSPVQFLAEWERAETRGGDSPRRYPHPKQNGTHSS